MASQVGICNLALTKLGAATIRDLQDGTRNANLMATIYDSCLDDELAAHPWSFATARALVPSSSTPPEFGFGNAYPLPKDYLKMLEVGTHWVYYTLDRCGPWLTIEGGSVLTNIGSPLQIRYVKRLTNTGQFAANFVQALACRLAAESAEALTQNLSKREAAWKEREQAITQAKRSNDIEKPPDNSAPASWEASLYGNAG